MITYFNAWETSQFEEEEKIPENLVDFYFLIKSFSPSLAKRMGEIVTKTEKDENDQTYLSNLHRLSSSSQGMRLFFDSLSSAYSDKENVKEFLKLWHQALTFSYFLPTALLTAFHDHLAHEPCNFLKTRIEVPFPKGRKMTSPNQVYGEIRSLRTRRRKGENVFYEYGNESQCAIMVRESAGEADTVLVDFCLTVTDLERYIELMENFWQTLSRSPFQKNNWVAEGSIYSNLIGSGIRLQVNLQDENLRINLKGENDNENNPFNGISIRVDKEKDGKISVDFGGINYQRLLNFSQKIAKLPVAEGQFGPTKKGALYQNSSNIRNDELIAIVNAVCFQEFSHLVDKKLVAIAPESSNESFSYHLRPSYLQKFSPQFKEILESIVGVR